MAKLKNTYIITKMCKFSLIRTWFCDILTYYENDEIDLFEAIIIMAAGVPANNINPFLAFSSSSTENCRKIVNSIRKGDSCGDDTDKLYGILRYMNGPLRDYLFILSKIMELIFLSADNSEKYCRLKMVISLLHYLINKKEFVDIPKIAKDISELSSREYSAEYVNDVYVYCMNVLHDKEPYYGQVLSENICCPKLNVHDIMHWVDFLEKARSSIENDEPNED